MAVLEDRDKKNPKEGNYGSGPADRADWGAARDARAGFEPGGPSGRSLGGDREAGRDRGGDRPAPVPAAPATPGPTTPPWWMQQQPPAQPKTQAPIDFMDPRFRWTTDPTFGFTTKRQLPPRPPTPPQNPPVNWLLGRAQQAPAPAQPTQQPDYAKLLQILGLMGMGR